MAGANTTRTVNPRTVVSLPTCVAGKTVAQAVTVNPNLGHLVLEAVQIIIPTGHVGLTGIGFDLAGTRILPYGLSTAFFTGNGTTIVETLGIEIDAGFVIRLYNLDAYNHGWIVNFKVSDIPLAVPQSGALILPIVGS